MATQHSQSWLAGQQVPLDAFLRLPSTSTSGTRNVKRKVDGKDASLSSNKKLRTYHSKSKQTELGRAQSNKHTILRDITEQQNSPRPPRRTRPQKTSSLRSTLKATSNRHKEEQSRESIGGLSGSAEESDGPQVSSRLFPTPVLSCKSRKGIPEKSLLSPPDSSHRSCREALVKATDEPSERLSSIKVIFGSKPETRTPFTVTGRHSYPTPETISRSRVIHSPAKNRLSSLSSTGTDSEPPSSPPLISLLEKLEEAKMLDAHDETVIPSSQTQYLHFSQRKRELPSATPPLFSNIPSARQDYVPSSQSQGAVYSPRKVRKPPPLLTRPMNAQTPGEAVDRAQPNFVVPTSQEDELELSLLDESCLNAPQIPREIQNCYPNRQCNDKSDSTPKKKISLDLDKIKFAGSPQWGACFGGKRVFEGPGSTLEAVADDDMSQTQSQTQEDSQLVCMLMVMRSSVTEADVENEDPFAPTNPAYQAFLQSKAPAPSGLPPSSTRPSESSQIQQSNPFAESHSVDKKVGSTSLDAPILTDTQSSVTQVDEEEEDPFPTLPPATTTSLELKHCVTTSGIMPDTCVSDLAPRPVDENGTRRDPHPSADRRARTPDHSQSDDRPQARSEYLTLAGSSSIRETQSLNLPGPMPNIGSFGDASEVFELSPRLVRTTVNRALRGKLRRASIDGRAEDEDDDESVPKEVRDFFGIFDSQTQESVDQ